VASIDATAGLHAALGGLCAGGFGSTLARGGLVWGVGIEAAVFGTLATRLVFEMRNSRTAVLALLSAAVCYTLAALTLLRAFPGLVARLAIVAQSTTLLLGHLMLVMSLAVYARYIVLDAQGKILRRGRRRQTGKTASPAGSRQSEPKPQQQLARLLEVSVSDTSTTQRIPPETPSPALDRRRLKVTAEPESATDDAVDQNEEDAPPLGKESSMPDAQKLSRAERKRLRKETRGRRRAA
jgi:hypothetical protein